MSSGLTSSDSLFYVGEVPWHGQGTPLPRLATAQEALEASGLSWTVEKKELRDDNYRRVASKYVLIRQDTGAHLGVVGRSYTVLQNAEAFQFMDEVTMDPRGPKYELAGSLNEGRIVWLLARFPEVIEVVRDEPLEPYLLLINGYDGRTAIPPAPNLRSSCMLEHARTRVGAS